jgi:ABC-type sugar transport system ATPase subunit
MTMADKIVVLNGGRIEQVGAPMTLYNEPASPFVAGFIGSPKMNLYDGDVAAREGCKVYGIRPEHLSLSATDGKWNGTVRHIERLGADTIAHLKVEGLGDLVARCPADMPISISETLFASPASGKEHKFQTGALV